MRKLYFFVLFTGLTFFISQNTFAQKKDDSQVVIDIRGIKKYHDLHELEKMSKGELIPLYIERVKILFNVIEYFGVSTKSGVTFKQLGIPVTKDNIKLLENEIENREAFLEGNEEFLNQILPYSDTQNIIKSILFYEEVLKLVHTIASE